MKTKYSVKIKANAVILSIITGMIVAVLFGIPVIVAVSSALLLSLAMSFGKMPVGSLMFALTAGLTKSCAARSGGMVRLYLANEADVTSFTLVGGTGAYSAVTMVATKVFYKFDFEQDSAGFKFDGTLENGSFKVDKTIEFFINLLSQVNRNGLQEIADSSSCGMIAIVEDNNATKWVFGYTEKFLKERPMKLQTNASDSGKAFTDANGTTVTLIGTDNEYPRTFTGSVPV